jgi:hypothetical protein
MPMSWPTGVRATPLQSEVPMQNIAEQNFAKPSGITWVARICGP